MLDIIVMGHPWNLQALNPKALLKSTLLSIPFSKNLIKILRYFQVHTKKFINISLNTIKQSVPHLPQRIIDIEKWVIQKWLNLKVPISNNLKPAGLYLFPIINIAVRKQSFPTKIEKMMRYLKVLKGPLPIISSWYKENMRKNKWKMMQYRTGLTKS